MGRTGVWDASTMGTWLAGLKVVEAVVYHLRRSAGLDPVGHTVRLVLDPDLRIQHTHLAIMKIGWIAGFLVGSV